MEQITTVRTTITFPGSWEAALQEAVKKLRVTMDPGARPNDIYREALRRYMVAEGHLKGSEQP